jgi:uncharacterized protein YggE
MRKATLLAASALFFATLTPAKGQTVPPPMLYGIDMPTVSINVTETEEAAPDIATISTGVQTTGKTAKEAMDLNTQKMAPLIAAIKANGIEAKDIQTTGLRLGADYDYTKAPRRLKGYSANNAVSVTIRDLSKLDKVMGALVGAGANELDGPYFSIDDTEALADKARDKAYDSALRRAQAYARRGGFKDVRLLTVSEGVANSFPVPMARMAMMEAASAPADAPPIEQGEVSVSVTADFTFAMVK